MNPGDVEPVGVSFIPTALIIHLKQIELGLEKGVVSVALHGVSQTTLKRVTEVRDVSETHDAACEDARADDSGDDGVSEEKVSEKHAFLWIAAGEG